MDGFLKAMLLPMAFQHVDIAEKSGKANEVKRSAVVESISIAAEELRRQGFLPDVSEADVVKAAGDLTDVAVAINKATGVFKKSAPKKEPPKPKVEAKPKGKKK